MAEKESRSSVSAAGVASVRAIEAQKPENERICYDPYAYLFVPKGIASTFSKWVITSGLYERMAPGAVAFIVGRERYIDDFLKTSLEQGLDQVVILGAGFDTRAYRTPGIEKTHVFEIDAPATQDVKLERLKKIIDPLPPYVTFLPVDFNTQELGEQLLSNGYNQQGKTLFIWQGVTYFLTAEGVDNTLAFVSQHSRPGSQVIFDYMNNEILRDPSRNDVKNLRRAARISGEAYLFGIDSGQAESFLTQRGFHDVHDLALEDLRPLYFTGPNAGRTLPTGICIVFARIK